LIVAGLVYPLGVAGCKSSPDTAERAASKTTPAPASAPPRPVHRPDLPPPLISQDPLPAPNSADAKARLSLAEVLGRIQTPAYLLADPPQPDDSLSAADAADAIKLYAAGRTAMLDGRLTEAVSLLQQTIQLDPLAAGAHALLGRIHFDANEWPAAQRHLTAAVSLQPADVRSLTMLGRLAEHEQRADQAIATLAAAVDRCDERTDPALRYMARYYLGQALLDHGYDAAAIQPLQAFALIRRQLDTTTAYQVAVAGLAQRRGPVHLQLGDALVRLGDIDQAIEHYRKARGFNAVANDELLARLIYASLLIGDDAAAADQLVKRIDWSGEFDRIHTLAVYAARHVDQPNELIDRLTEHYRLSDQPEALAMALGRAIAVGNAASARSFLLEHCRENPDHWRAFGQLLALLLPDKPNEAMDVLLGRIEKNPRQAARYVAALLSASPPAGTPLTPQQWLQRLEAREALGQQTAEQAYVGGMLLLEMNRIDAARAAFERAMNLDADFLPAPAAIIELTLQQGEYVRALNLLDGLGPSDWPHVSYLRIRALSGAGRLDEARQLLESLLADHPDNVRYLGFLAAVQRQQKQFDAAEQTLLHVLELEPTSEVAYAALFNIYETESPDAGKFVLLLRRLQENLPGSRLTALKTARLQVARRQFSQAEQLLRNALSQWPDEPQAIRDLVALLGRQDRWDEARAFLIEHSDAHPDLLAPLQLLRDVAGRTGDLEPYFTRMQRYLESLAPGVTRWQGLAQLYVEWDKPAEAIEAVQAALAMDPEQAMRYRMQLVQLYQRTDQFDQAIDQVDQLLAENPEDVALHVAKAQLLQESDRTAEAIDLLSDLAERSPPDREADVRLILARFLAEADRMDQAMAQVDRVIATQPQRRADLTYVKAGLEASFGQSDRAEVLLQRVLTMEPNHPAANNDLGYTWVDRGENLARAEAMIRRAVAQEPANAAYLDSLGWALYKQGQFGEAVRWLARAVSQPGGQDPVLLDHLGDALWNNGQTDQAVEQWNNALELLKRADDHGLGMRRDDRKLRRSVEQKLGAVERGDRPAVAPFAEPPDDAPQTPAPAEAQSL
jgi:tetratricopeptide (TPR) repeat protein